MEFLRSLAIRQTICAFRVDGGEGGCRAANPGACRDRHDVYAPVVLHTATDDHSCLAYSDIHADETGATPPSGARQAFPTTAAFIIERSFIPLARRWLPLRPVMAASRRPVPKNV
jgi:hypothetical protein